MDYDGDGDLDILSGSYTGEIYLFEGAGGMSFAQGRFLLNREGDPLEVGMSVTPEAVDYDGDGDLDLVIGTRMSGVQLVVNEGTRQAPLWAVKTTPLRTVSGKKVKGSNAHHADWDGDGVQDLLVGSEHGGAYWYRNLGENNHPIYGEQEVLVPESPFEERSEEDGPVAPGSRTKVSVTDWNNDGQLDLLIGDVQWLYRQLPPLTEKQEAEKRALKPTYDRLNDDYSAAVKERNKYVGKPGGIPQEVIDAMGAARKALGPVAKTWSSFDRKKSVTHGWVWLCLGIAPGKKTGASTLEAGSQRQGTQEFGPTILKVVSTPIEGDPRRLSIEASLTIDSGWHVYAELPKESEYTLVHPALTLPAGVEMVSPWKCSSVSVPDFNNPQVSWYVDQAKFTCEVRLLEASTPGLKVSMHFQACDDEMCLPVHSSEVSLD